MATAEHTLAEPTPSGARNPGLEFLQTPEAPAWDAAITLFIEGWAADHPGIRPTTRGYYREQLVNRIAAFAEERGIATVPYLTRHHLRAFIVWLDSFLTANRGPLTPHGKQMALATAEQFLGWLYRECPMPDDIATYVGAYRLDADHSPGPLPRRTLRRSCPRWT